jgi:hypothetical protein
MKTIILILLAITISTTTVDSDFCEGFEKGYKNGYCFKEALPCLSPLPPLCPLPELNQDSYQDGYNVGFVRGREDKEDE